MPKRSVQAAVALIVALIVLTAAGCVETAPEDQPATGSERVALTGSAEDPPLEDEVVAVPSDDGLGRDEPLDPTGAAPPLAGSSWLPDVGRGPVEGQESVGFRVTSYAREDLSVGASLVFLGLDGKMVETPVANVLLPPGANTVFEVALDSFGIVSSALSSEVVVELEVHRATGEVRTYVGSPLYYHSSVALDSITVYGFDDMVDRFGGGLVRSDGRSVSGSVLQADGRRAVVGGESTELTAAAGRTASGTYVQGATVVVRGRPDETLSLPSGSADAAAASGEGMAGPLDAGVTVCSNWKSSFTDVGYGEDYLTGTGVREGSAAWTMYGLYNSSGLLVSNGYLDIIGCTPSLALPAGTYTLYQGIYLQKGSAQFKIQKAVLIPGYSHDGTLSHYNLYGYFAVTGFTLSGTPSGYVYLHPTPLENWTRLAYEIGFFLNRPDNGIGDGSYFVYHEINCPNTDGPVSCYQRSPESIWMDASTCDNKFIFAHELGHYFQARSTGLPQVLYGAGELVPTCSCNHVLPESWRPHCLQSREYLRVGLVEGFGYFWAAKVFNSMSGSDCRVVHPKAFREDSGAVVGPPYPADCRSHIRWMENHCTQADRGVEWDWVNFFWNWHTVSSDKATMADIYDVIWNACTAGCQSWETILWSGLRNAAIGKWGISGPKFIYFDTEAGSNGVDH
jgi:hypothetical protein